MFMTAELLRDFWSLVEVSSASMLLKLDDADLVQRLVQQINETRLLTHEENDHLTTYARTRTPLIRDLVEARPA